MPVRQPVLSRQRKVGSGGRGGKVGGGREVVMRERETHTHTQRQRQRDRQRERQRETERARGPHSTSGMPQLVCSFFLTRPLSETAVGYSRECSKAQMSDRD